MGRHAKGATRSRVSLATMVFGFLIVVVIAVGSWLSSRAQPIDQAVDASAVVVSSLACTDGAGGTLVDLQNPAGLPAGSVLRASLDACGYQEGQQLAVQYRAGNPTQVSLTGTDSSSDTGTGKLLLPVGLIIAGLLAIGAGVAVLVDGRRSRRATAGGRRSAAHQVSDQDGSPAFVGETEPMPLAARPDISSEKTLFRSVDRRQGRHALPENELVVTVGSPTDDSSGPAGPVGETRPGRAPGNSGALAADTGRLGALSAVQVFSVPQEQPHGVANWPAATPELSSVDLVFPFASSLAASLHDELFTHRRIPG